MNRQGHSAEFAGRQAPPPFCRGDRVQVRETANRGTVRYAVTGPRGTFVTVVLDGETRRRQFLAGQLVRIEALL